MATPLHRRGLGAGKAMERGVDRRLRSDQRRKIDQRSPTSENAIVIRASWWPLHGFAPYSYRVFKIEVLRGPPIRETDLKAPAKGHSFMLDDTDAGGHGQIIAPHRRAREAARGCGLGWETRSGALALGRSWSSRCCTEPSCKSGDLHGWRVCTMDRLRKFRQQRSNAKRRGIGWELTFRQWCKIWDDSGL
jgi:hypothetical protein